MPAIDQSKPCCAMVITDSTCSAVGGKPAPVSWNDSAMAKHPACAAAISSSGLVPLRPSASANRIFVEYGCPANTPLGVVKLPAPSNPVPCQTAFALRRIDHSCCCTVMNFDTRR